MESHSAIVSSAISFEKHDLNSVSATINLESEKISSVAQQAPVGSRMAGIPAVDGDVRILTLGEYKAAALSLAEAFVEDHTSVYFTHTPDRAHWSDAQKWDLHLKMMEYITYAHLLKGLVVSTGPNYDSVALWMPPGKNMDDYLTIVRSGMWRLSYQLSAEGRKRFFDEFLPLLGSTKAQVMGTRDNDSWYLVYVGTRPSGRGKGYARKVIEYVTRMADEQGRACYLESSSEVNQIIYGKLGFRNRKAIYLQRDTEHVQMDIMVREPKQLEAEPELKIKKSRQGSDADSGVYVK